MLSYFILQIRFCCLNLQKSGLDRSTSRQRQAKWPLETILVASSILTGRPIFRPSFISYDHNILLGDMEYVPIQEGFEKSPNLCQSSGTKGGLWGSG